MNKQLEELSKPVAYAVVSGRYYNDKAFINKTSAERSRTERNDGSSIAPLYSQEYVNALLAEMAALRAIAEEYRDLMHHMDAGGDFYQFQRDKAGEK
ncbi:hypothetical protein [Serratia rubidaea]|uniref:hypothetical protein n=1 Tax=Serratia rubidaea TaxID=61652 RepID=UPI003FA373C2